MHNLPLSRLRCKGYKFLGKIEHFFFRRTLRTRFFHFFVLLYTTFASIAGYLPPSGRTHKCVIRIGTHPSGDGLRSNWLTLIPVSNKIVVTDESLSRRRSRNIEMDKPLVIKVSTLTIIFMYYGILIFLAHVALSIGFSTLIPLL